MKKVLTARWQIHLTAHSMLEKIETVRERIRTATDLYDRLRAQIEETILRLPNENMRLVLLYHYLEGRSFSQIGDILFLNKGSAARCAARGIEELVLPEEPIDVFSEICNEGVPEGPGPSGTLILSTPAGSLYI